MSFGNAFRACHDLAIFLRLHEHWHFDHDVPDIDFTQIASTLADRDDLTAGELMCIPTMSNHSNAPVSRFASCDRQGDYC